MSRKKKAKAVEDTTPLPEFEQPFVESVEEKPAELREVIQPESNKPKAFRSLREAKAYAKENGGTVVERGKFYVR